MLDVKEIHSLTDFTRNTREMVGRIKKTKKPLVLTVNGKAEVIVQDAIAYQELLEHIEKLEAIEGIRQGLESMRQGKGKTLEQFKEEMSKKHGLPLTRPGKK
jgi:PHD/YefM family antitoxin component YafN of YafNO toxin-antitoxin module